MFVTAHVPVRSLAVLGSWPGRGGEHDRAAASGGERRLRPDRLGARRDTARAGTGYGPLAPVGDQDGAEILALPAGFSYVTFSKTANPLISGGGVVPRNHDGMGAFAGPDGTVRLIRNHENRNDPCVPLLGAPGPAATKYEPLAYGGTVTVD